MPASPGSAAQQQDFDKLLEQVRSFAGDLIGGAGGCPPFGATVGADGKVGLVVLQPAPGKQGQDLIDMLSGSLRQEAKAEKLRVVSIAYSVTAEVQGQPLTALVASVQHRSGPPLELIIPFTRSGKNVQFADPIVQKGKLSFF